MYHNMNKDSESPVGRKKENRVSAGVSKFLHSLSLACKNFTECPDTPALTLRRYRMVCSQQLCEGGDQDTPSPSGHPTYSMV